MGPTPIHELPPELASSAWFRAIGEHALRCYPEECCGAIVARGEAGLVAVPCRNIQNHLHAADPAAHRRDARTAFQIDPADLMAIDRDPSTTALRAIYHSHTDAGAYFSETDQRQAAPLGEPLLPDVHYLVISVGVQGLRETALYTWDDRLGCYAALPLESLLAK